MTYSANIWAVLVELAPWLLLGAAIAGVLHVVVPEGLIRRQLRGPAGVVRAAIFGVPLPLCSCGVIPAGLGLKRDGASDGAAVAFLTATPQTGVDSILVSASFLGWPFALTKVGAALVTGVAAGWITEALSAPPPETALVVDPQARRTWRDGVSHGIDMVRMIWRWLVFGILVSAALSTWLPAGALAGLAQTGTLLTFAAVLGASVPLYVCATASVPIAAALVAGGMPTGAALVFLMAGPATNVATLGAVKSAFGGRTLAIYLSTIVVGSVAFGLGYEALFGDLAAGAAGSHLHRNEPYHLAAFLLVGMLGWFAVEEGRVMWSNWRSQASESQEVVVQVAGMSCNGCASRLQRVLIQQEGVEAATVSFEDGVAVVKGLIDLQRVEQAVRGAGFEPG